MEPDQGPVTLSRLQRTIVTRLAPRDEVQDILDDLADEAAQIAGRDGAGAARRWLRWQVVHSTAPWIARRSHDLASGAGEHVMQLHRGLLSDIRVGARRLAHARGFTALSVLTLAISIGAVSSVFSLAYALWLKPLPYFEPDRLVWIHAKHTPSGTSSPLTYGEFSELQRESRSFDGVAAFIYSASIIRVGGERVRVVTHRITHNLFRVLGVPPARGRDFTAADAHRESRVVMLSHAAWSRRFGRDPSLVGRTIAMDGASYEVVGIMPQGFTFPRGMEADAWMPMLDPAANLAEPERLLQAVARLAPQRTLAEAAAEADVRARRLAEAFPETNATWSTIVTPAGVTTSESGRRAFQALLGIVALFLLIACTNLGGMLLARNASRRPELALCLSIGASRIRLARMLVVESLMLAAVGCAAGLLLASYAARALTAVMPPRMPGLGDVAVSAPVVALAAGASLLCALTIGLLPAASFRSMRPAEALAGARTVVRGTARAQRALVIVEIVLALILVVGATVMMRTFVGMLERDRGYDPRGLLSLNVSLPFGDDSYLPTETRARAFDAILERVAAVPGVRRVAATTGFPGSPLGILAWTPVTPPAGDRQIVVAVHASSPGYFETMGVPIKAGRAFAVTDTVRGPRVALVNEVLAREFPGGNPIGHRIPLAIQGEKADYEIVGIAGNIKLTERVGHRVFVPIAQASPYWLDLVLRADSAAVMPAVRQTLREMGKDLLIENESSFARTISDSLALERAQSTFAAMVGALSAVVAGVGLYALMAFLVAQRRREFGIRLALGSQPRRLFHETIASALRLVSVGLVLGVVASAVLVRALSARVFGLTSVDLPAYAGAVALLLVVAIAAAWIPARRVMRTDPLIAMRAE